jgi:hypothetical protein
MLTTISRQYGAVIATGVVPYVRRRPKNIARATVEADAVGGPFGAPLRALRGVILVRKPGAIAPGKRNGIGYC